MSNNTETLKLYKQPQLYNGSRYKFYHDTRDYDTWLESTSGTPYEKTVYYKSINEPILINEFIKNCDEYTYGSITNEGKTYYFFIDNISTDAYKQTTINFSVDWWATNWSNITCTKAHISRSSTKPKYMQQPFSPMNIEFTKLENIGDESGVIVFTYTDSLTQGTIDRDRLRYGVIDINALNGLEDIEIGNWASSVSKPQGSSDHVFTSGDILGIFIVPIFNITDFENAGWTKVVGTTINWYCSDDAGSSKSPEKLVTFDSIYTSEAQVYGIMDWNGNSIWECPYGITIDSFNVKLSLSSEHVQLRFKYDNEFGNENTGKGFTYECRKCAIIIDQETEYTWRERESEYQIRRLQSAKQVWTNASDAVQGAGFGLAFGGMPGVAAATAGGIINTISTWAMNEVFDPRFQEAQDYKYQRMQDLVSVYGDSITAIYDYKIGDNYIYFIQAYNSTVYHNYKFYIEHQTPEYIIRDVKIYYPDRTINTGDIFFILSTTYDNETGEITRRIFREDESVHNVDNVTAIYNSQGIIEYYDVVNNVATGTTEASFPIYSVRQQYNSASDIQSYTDAYSVMVGSAPVNGSIGLFMIRFHWINPPGNNYRTWHPSLAYYSGGKWTTVIDYKTVQGDSWNDDYFIATTYNPLPSGQIYSNLMYKYKLTMDSATISRMTMDLATNGYYCDETTASLQTKFKKGAVIQADNVTVEGACTLEGKQQVVYRLSRGVEFI